MSLGFRASGLGYGSRMVSCKGSLGKDGIDFRRPFLRNLLTLCSQHGMDASQMGGATFTPLRSAINRAAPRWALNRRIYLPLFCNLTISYYIFSLKLFQALRFLFDI